MITQVHESSKREIVVLNVLLLAIASPPLSGSSTGSMIHKEDEFLLEGLTYKMSH